MGARKVVSLYHQGHDADRFEVAFVEAVSSEDVTLRCLTPRGEEDGQMVARLEDISAIEIDDPYSQKIQLLHSYRGSVFERDEAVRIKSAGASADDQLRKAHEEGQVVAIEDVAGARFTGFIAELTDSYIEVSLLNQYGAPDGSAYLARHMLGKIDIARREEQTRGFLYRVNHGLKRLIE